MRFLSDSRDNWNEMRLALSIALLLAGGGIACAQPYEDRRDLLLHVSQAVMDTVNRVPQYISTELIERRYFEPATGLPLRNCDDALGLRKAGHWKVRLATSDKIRVDLAIVAGNDTYSWLGENRFDDADLKKMVLYGASSTGVLVGTAGLVFSGQDGADFTYNGDRNEGGRRLAEYGFRVPQSKSHKIFETYRVHVTAAYEGTFLADPATGDLVQLIVRTFGLPNEAVTCEVTETLDYGRVTIAGSSFLLPLQTMARFVNRDGSEFENRITFSNFRKFQPPAEPEVKPRELPPLSQVIPFAIGLKEPVDMAATWFGDRVHAVLLTDMEDVAGNLLIPAGAAVDGRVIKLLHAYGSKESMYTVAVGFRWETINDRGVARPFQATQAPPGWMAPLDCVKRHIVPCYQAGRGTSLPDPHPMNPMWGFPITNLNGLIERRGLAPGFVLLPPANTNPNRNVSVWVTTAQ